jgi:hypothetical protein
MCFIRTSIFSLLQGLFVNLTPLVEGAVELFQRNVGYEYYVWWFRRAGACCSP